MINSCLCGHGEWCDSCNPYSRIGNPTEERREEIKNCQEALVKLSTLNHRYRYNEIELENYLNQIEELIPTLRKVQYFKED